MYAIRSYYGVIGADVVLLRPRVAEHAAGAEEKLADLHIGRQAAVALRVHVFQIRHAGKHAVHERLQERPFEGTAAAGFLQRQCAQNRQPRNNFV